MQPLLSERIIRSISKYILQFTDYWFENYIHQILPTEVTDQKEILTDFRQQTVETIGSGLRAIATQRIDEKAYFELGATQFENGITYGQTLELRYAFEEAMECFLIQINQRNDLELSDREIADYITALKQLNDILTPIIAAGHASKQ